MPENTVNDTVDGVVRLVLGDDQLIFLDGMTTLLTQLGHEVAATAASLLELQNAIQTTRPDVIVTDVSVGGLMVADHVHDWRRASPRSRVLILTANSDPESLQRALAAGASGFISKAHRIGALVDAIDMITRGHVVVEASFAHSSRNRDGVAGNSTVGPNGAEVRRLAGYLTARERQCLTLLTGGHTTASMATTLGVSVTTVRTHVQAVLSKLGVHSRLEAASLAAQHQLVEMQSPYDELRVTVNSA